MVARHVLLWTTMRALETLRAPTSIVKHKMEKTLAPTIKGATSSAPTIAHSRAISNVVTTVHNRADISSATIKVDTSNVADTSNAVVTSSDPTIAHSSKVAITSATSNRVREKWDSSKVVTSNAPIIAHSSKVDTSSVEDITASRVVIASKAVTSSVGAAMVSNASNMVASNMVHVHKCASPHVLSALSMRSQ